MPPRYKDVDECRQSIQDYIRQLESGTDDNDPELRDQSSTQRYKQDLRWYDDWLDDRGIESPSDVTSPDAQQVGTTLANEFHGTTPLYRWDQIFAFHDWLVRMELADSNPFEKWNADKDEKFGFTKTTEQSKRLEDGEEYATSQEEIRQMEENVGTYRVRDQLIIRLLWQTGVRRDEAAKILLTDINKDQREITIRASVAKNDKKRVVAFQQSLDGLLKEWLEYGLREEMLGGKDHEYLFVGERGAPLSDDRINEIVIEAAKEAGINRLLYADANAPVNADGEKEPNRWLISAHNIRHGYGTYMVDETDAGLWEVSKQMGHSSVDITERLYVEDNPRSGIEHAHKYGPS